MKRNIIEIRHGYNPPKAGDLEAYELGFCGQTEELYIGAPEKNVDPILINKKQEEPTEKCLPLDGGTMLGDIDMGEKRIKNLASPTEAGDASTKKYVDDGLGGKADSSHSHSASDIRSGTLPVEYGGTGVTTNNAIGLMAYPVGSIYMSVNTTSPATLFGGTWEQLKDRFLLGAGSSYTNGSTGGEAEHTLTVDEMPSHSHGLPITTNGTISSNNYFKATANQGGTYYTPQTINTGGSQAHNNMPPYLVVYMWKRTA